jgi:uncharacterized protein YkwD
VTPRLFHVCFRATLLVGVLVALLAVNASSRPAQAVVNCTIETSLDSEERQFLTLINNHRAQNGLNPLGVSYRLSRAAQWKSNDLGVNAYFAHDDLNRSWVQRIRDCGYGYNAWLGENIAGGTVSAQSAFDIWRNSPGHNANMLNTNYTTIGIGRANVPGSPFGWYWTTEFGSVHDGWAAATSAAPQLPDEGDVPLTLTIKQRKNGHTQLVANVPRRSEIARVDFYIDGRLVATDRRAPFTATWRERAPAEIRVVAFDAQRRVIGTHAVTGAATSASN